MKRPPPAAASQPDRRPRWFGGVSGKLFFLIYVTVVALSILLGVLAYTAARRIAVESVTAHEIRFIREVSNLVHQGIEDLRTQMETIAFDEGLNEVLRDHLIDSLDERKYIVDEQLRRQVYAANMGRPIIAALVVADLAGNTLGYLGRTGLAFRPDLDSVIRSSEWFQDLADRPRWYQHGFARSDLFLPGFAQGHRLAMTLTVMDLRYYPNYRPQGIIHVVLDNAYFAERARELVGDEAKEVTVIDGNGYIVISFDENEIGRPFQLFDTDDLLGSLQDAPDEHVFSISRPGRDTLGIHVLDPRYNWRYIETIPVDFIQANLRGTVTMIVGAILLVLVAAFIVVRVEVGRTLAPLRELRRTMGAIGEGVVTRRLEHDSEDEIGVLGRSFNTMMDRLSAAEREKQRREFEALQAQINPHFLYNTLNTIRMMAIIQNAGEIRYAVSSLIKLFRNTIGQEGVFVSVSDEIETLKHYVRLQQLRYGDSFAVTYRIDDEVLHLMVLRLTLQPIVENAILHGVRRPSSTPGKIEIAATIDRGSGAPSSEAVLVCTVTDDGPGMDAATAASLPERNERPGGERSASIGIPNVHRRIRLYHGDRYGLKFRSRPGEGTTVSIVLPALTADSLQASWVSP